MDSKRSSWRRELIQWTVAIVLVLAGITVWRLSSTPQAQAQSNDGGGGCEGQ